MNKCLIAKYRVTMKFKYMLVQVDLEFSTVILPVSVDHRGWIICITYMASCYWNWFINRSRVGLVAQKSKSHLNLKVIFRWLHHRLDLLYQLSSLPLKLENFITFQLSFNLYLCHPCLCVSISLVACINKRSSHEMNAKAIFAVINTS